MDAHTRDRLRRYAPRLGAALVVLGALGYAGVRRSAPRAPPPVDLAAVAAMPCSQACASYPLHIRDLCGGTGDPARDEARYPAFQNALRIWQATPGACHCPRPELNLGHCDSSPVLR